MTEPWLIFIAVVVFLIVMLVFGSVLGNDGSNDDPWDRHKDPYN